MFDDSRLRRLAGALVATVFCTLAVAAGANVAAAANEPRATLTAFRSDEELLRYLKKVKRAARRAAPQPAPMADGAVASAPAQAQESAKSEDQSITNTQEAGVDEGGIVKMYGDTLVVLRRGRLFTVSTRGSDLRPLDSIDAYPPGVNPSGDWYDEMLIAGNRVIVIGYSYSRGGTEINRFRIDGGGRLSFVDSYHLRSNDYYSSRNYASRLIGNRLIVYSPLYLPYGIADSLEFLPALRKWTGSGGGFQRIVSARDIFIPPNTGEEDEADVAALHTVTNCDLTAPVLQCRATSVLGPAGRSFYVSPSAVYVWVTSYASRGREGAASSMLYRMPLDGRAPSAIGVRGAPTDQFSFREDWNDGRLNVLVRAQGAGDAMWAGEFSDGRVALLQVPLDMFGDGAGEASRRFYRMLPSPSGGYGLQNRFVGDYVLYGTGNSWWKPGDQPSSLVVASVRGRGVSEMTLRHGIDRIEALGRDAVVVGADSRDLHFQAVELTQGWRPALGDRYTLEHAAQGETRSHGFFYKPESGDQTAGVLGLPVARAGRPGHRQLSETSAAITFLRRENRSFVPLGELVADEERLVDDACKASCADWYGNARPIFLRERTFALMGYELVEGEIRRGSIRETRRVSFAPR